MNRKNIFLIFSLSLLTVVLLAACNSTSKRIGWTCLNSANELDCEYQYFTGREAEGINLDYGETLAITEEVQVESGVLRVYVQNPDGETIWETDFTQTSSDAIKIQADEGGFYRLTVEGIEARGAFNIHWQIIS